MKKLFREILIFLIAIIICMLWIYRGFIIGWDNWNSEKEKEISGKVKRMIRPETEKNYHIYFEDGSKYVLSFWELNELIEPGDSIFKPKGSYRFEIYKSLNKIDTIIFEGKSNFYK